MNISIASDHAGYELKELVKNNFSEINFTDFGTNNLDSCDYPDFVHPLCQKISDFDFGILICGSANGVAMTANKHSGVRAAICWNTEVSKLARQHNDANIICIPGRFLSVSEVFELIRIFINTKFEGGRHQNRVNKINLC